MPRHTRARDGPGPLAVIEEALVKEQIDNQSGEHANTSKQELQTSEVEKLAKMSEPGGIAESNGNAHTARMQQEMVSSSHMVKRCGKVDIDNTPLVVGGYHFDIPPGGCYTRTDAIVALLQHSETLQKQGIKKGQGVTLTEVIRAMIARRLIPLKEPSKLLRRVKNAHRAEAQGKNWKLLEHDWSQAGRRPITNRGDLQRVTAAALRNGQGPVGEEFYATFLTQEMTKNHHNARSPVPSVPTSPCKKTIRKYMRIAADTPKPTVVAMLLKAIRQVCVVAISNFSKRYESVVLADATKLWWWSGNGHFCVAMVYNLPLPAMPSTKRKSESAHL